MNRREGICGEYTSHLIEGIGHKNFMLKGNVAMCVCSSASEKGYIYFRHFVIQKLSAINFHESYSLLLGSGIQFSATIPGIPASRLRGLFGASLPSHMLHR